MRQSRFWRKLMNFCGHFLSIKCASPSSVLHSSLPTLGSLEAFLETPFGRRCKTRLAFEGWLEAFLKKPFEWHCCESIAVEICWDDWKSFLRSLLNGIVGVEPLYTDRFARASTRERIGIIYIIILI